jgi:hypothetical protein
MRHIRFALVMSAGLCLWACFLVILPSAYGWEFQMEGQVTWTYQWFSQKGHQGFFGPYNIDNGLGTTTANLNFWSGGLMDTDMSAGADQHWTNVNAKIQPTLKINEAIRIRGQYRIGLFGDPTADNDYHTNFYPGVDNAISEGKWTMFWVTAQTPVGTFVVGKRRWLWGTSLQYDGQDSASTESVLLVSPFGPLDIGIGFSPYTFAGGAARPPTILPPPLPILQIDPYDLNGRQYYNRSEKSGSFSSAFLGFVRYSAGPLLIGIMGNYGSFHIGPESRLGGNLFLAQDSELFHGSAFVKYTNARFFFNGEAAWLYWTDRFSGQTQQVGPQNPRYIEQWRYMTEFGVMVGPAKVSFLHAWLPGPDRRNGVLIGKQTAAFIWHPTFDSHLGNYSLFRPYAYNLSSSYGGGLKAYDLSVNGYLRDAWVLAARLDYAVASNLNFFLSGVWAERTSNGYGWGCLAPNDENVNGIPNDGNISLNINGAAGSPNIPDRALGYEASTGVDWKLLEGWTLSGVFAYWQPGRWFNYACIDRSIPSWNVPGPGNSFGVRPDRHIDPVMGGEVTLVFSF